MQYRVETHPQRQQIIDAMVLGRPLREIAKWTDPPISVMALQRFRALAVAPAARRAVAANTPQISQNKETKALRKAVQAEVLASPFRERLEKLWGRTERALDRAEAAKELTPIAPLLNQAHKNCELLGRVTGELEVTGPTNIAINIVVPLQPQPERELEPARTRTIDIQAQTQKDR